MPERDLFDQLSEIEGEGPRIGFLDDLERRVLAARTDVGPATPTDHLIEGVVPMPDTPTARSPRLPLFVGAAAAVILVLTLVVLLGGDDETSEPTDVVTEPDTTTTVTPEPESDTTEPATTATDEDDVDDASTEQNVEAQAEAEGVADAWTAAYVSGDEAAFRALHAADAAVTGTVFEPGAAPGTLADPAIAETYWNGWEARRAYDDRWGIVSVEGTCTAASGGFDCVSTVPAFGPGSEPFREFRARLDVADGLVTSVVTSFAYVDADGDLVGGAPQFFLPAALDVEGSPPGQACIDIDFNSVECALESGEYWIAHFRQFVPEALVLPE